jgi:hypothetical protein
MDTDALLRLERLLLMLMDGTTPGTFERGLMIAALALLGEIKPGERAANPGLYRVQ